MTTFDVTFDDRSWPSTLNIEMVERKGLGHPDTLADAVAEATSRRYAAFCIAHFGAVAHHWFDKVMLIGGEAETGFQRGRIIRPVRAILVGKAVLSVGDVNIPLLEIFKEAVAGVFAATLKNYQIDDYCVYELQVHDGVGPGQRSIRYRPATASELREFEAGHFVSNDCNLCVGFAPYTPTEALSLELEQFLLSPQQQQKRPWLGSDIKTVITRIGQKTQVLANIPMLGSHVESLEAYLGMRAALEAELVRHCGDHLGGDCEVVVNPEWVHDRAYLTVTGTCLDTGDIGVVGRGNRHSGLITPMRSMSIEASAGKNPLDHTGKLLNVAASIIAQRIHEALQTPNTVYIYAKKGDRIEEPTVVGVLAEAGSAASFANVAKQISREVLGDLNQIRASLLAGAVRLF